MNRKGALKETLAPNLMKARNPQSLPRILLLATPLLLLNHGVLAQDPNEPEPEPPEQEQPEPEEPEEPEQPEQPEQPVRPDPAEDRPIDPADPIPTAPTDPALMDEVPPPPDPEPAREAEAMVRETTREVEQRLRRREIRNEQEAQDVIDQILGTEGRISQAEVLREERVRPRIDPAVTRQDLVRPPVAAPAQVEEAADYFRQRLRGELVEVPPPVLLRRDDRRGRPLPREVVREEWHQEWREEVIYHPRYLHEGRRYVHYDSRASIPAVLVAAAVLERVTILPAQQVAPIFFEVPADLPPGRALPMPPPNYRDETSWVVSYPVNERSMITSDDILFRQGSTQFADPVSYDIVSALADAMRTLPEDDRFVIEGHASAEGSYDFNMMLSQQRAERIVREMVRRGVSPHRLIPVGYGESEARYPEDAPELLRQRDRRVVVFSLDG